MSDSHLVLGGNGFIGRHVTVALAGGGRHVTVASRAPPNWITPEAAKGRVDWRYFEFASADWASLIEKQDVIHHYVWTSIPASANANPLGDLNINVASTISLLEEMRRQPGKRLVFASSGGTVYGKLRETPVRESHPFRPITAYGAGKASAEIYLNFYRAMHGLDCRIARISNPYGAGQDVNRRQGAATTFLSLAMAERPIVIWGDGEVVRDYIHIADVVEALLTLADAPDPGEDSTFNVGSNVGVSLNQIVAELEKLLNRPIDVRRETARAFDLPVSILDIAWARKALRWSPRLSLPEGLSRTMADLASNLPISNLDLP